MRDLSKRGVPAAVTPPPQGLAFDMADLLLAKGWADFHGLSMCVRLDHGAPGEDYEEVIAFHAERGSLCRWMMWCTAVAVVIQPRIGGKTRYASLSEALEALLPKPRTPLTDIVATEWPVGEL